MVSSDELIISRKSTRLPRRGALDIAASHISLFRFEGTKSEDHVHVQLRLLSGVGGKGCRSCTFDVGQASNEASPGPGTCRTLIEKNP
jgi:hypothetical protein